MLYIECSLVPGFETILHATVVKPQKPFFHYLFAFQPQNVYKSLFSFVSIVKSVLKCTYLIY